ncbi:MAG: hypothetical protein DRI89_10625 [Bacteroidetes bacterium]|nr:MAG: hypothetical protein DRI89_10625 [Bacteroidota bacterium]
MKKLLFLSTFLFLTSTIFSQSPWWVGGRLGIGFTTVSGQYGNSDNAKHCWITSPLFGATGIYTFSDIFSLQAELNMAKSGMLIKDNFDIGPNRATEYDYSFRERFTTIQIPILARFTFGKTWQFFTYGGFYWSYILGGKYVVKSDYFKESGKIKFGDKPDHYEGDDLYLDKDRYRRMDIGLNIGGGVQRQLGPGMLFLDLRFGLGFLDFNKFPEDVDKPDGYKSFNNRSLSLSAGYIFNLGK